MLKSSQQFLLKAEVDFWQEMIRSREKILNTSTLKEMKRLQQSARFQLGKLLQTPQKF
jgi:hypothetical protein